MERNITYEGLLKFMKEYMIRKVTLRGGKEIYYGKNGKLYTIKENGEKDYGSVLVHYIMLGSMVECESKILGYRNCYPKRSRQFFYANT